MGDLIARLEAAGEGSRELDGAIALATGLYNVWLSKHRYWCFEGKDGSRFDWPEPIPRFDVDTGKKIELAEYPDAGWVWDSRASVPEYTTSLDAALTLVPEGWNCELTIFTNVEGEARLHEWALPCRKVPEVGIIRASTPALALCIAALKARDHG